MCGIAGIVTPSHRESALRNRVVLRILSKIQDRGPEETRLRAVPGASIGVCRCNIGDAEPSSQPVSVSCRGAKYTVALNGEIYNSLELRPLLRRPHRFHSRSGIEVLAHLFEEEGVACLQRLNGMFALCISDGSVTYLIRDRFGEKPLYYRRDGHSLVFSSTASTLVSPSELAAWPNVPALEDSYADFETTLGPRTPFPNVFEVPPGHYLAVDWRTGQAALHRYYSLGDWPVEPLDAKAEHSAVREFRDLVEDAIRLRTGAGGDYGCYVSGGLDSSIIASLTTPTALFSAVVTDRPYMDERHYLNMLYDRLDTPCFTVSPDYEEFAEHLVDLVATLDFPVTSLAAFTQYLLSREAAAKGLRIMLSGLGADEYLGGYARHAAMAARDEPALLRAQFPEYKRLFSKLGDQACPPHLAYYGLISRRPGTVPDAHQAGADVVRRQFSRQRTLVNRLASVDMAISFPPLLRLDDRINMRFGIESRSPFLDHRVVEYAHRLPDQMKIRRMRDGTLLTKYILRRAFQELLPEQIVARRDKIGFPSPVTLWLNGPLRPLVQRARTIVSENDVLRPWLDTHPEHDNEFSRAPWQLVQWAVWHLLFVRGLSREAAHAELVPSS